MFCGKGKHRQSAMNSRTALLTFVLLLPSTNSRRVGFLMIMELATLSISLRTDGCTSSNLIYPVTFEVSFVHDDKKYPCLLTCPGSPGRASGAGPRNLHAVWQIDVRATRLL